jgi:hypothetical protein
VADAWAVVVRYADFFDACRGAIGDSLNAAPLPRASSVRRDVLWQDYGYANGTRVVVGLLHTDEFEKRASAGVNPCRGPVFGNVTRAPGLVGLPRGSRIEPH